MYNTGQAKPKPTVVIQYPSILRSQTQLAGQRLRGDLWLGHEFLSSAPPRTSYPGSQSLEFPASLNFARGFFTGPLDNPIVLLALE